MKFVPSLKSQARLSCLMMIVFVMFSLSALSFFAIISSHILVVMMASLCLKTSSCKCVGQSKVVTSRVLFVYMKQLFNWLIIVGVAVLRTNLVSSRFDMTEKIEKFGHKLAISSN